MNESISKKGIVVEIINIFFMSYVISMGLLASEITCINDLIIQGKKGMPIGKSKLLHTLKVELRTSQNKRRYQVMIDFSKTLHGVNFD